MSDYGTYSGMNGASSFLDAFMRARQAASAERQQRAVLALQQQRQASLDAQDRALKKAEIGNYADLAQQRQAEQAAAAAALKKKLDDDVYTPPDDGSAAAMSNTSTQGSGTVAPSAGNTQGLGPLAPNPGGTGPIGVGAAAVVAPGRLGSLPNNGVATGPVASVVPGGNLTSSADPYATLTQGAGASGAVPDGGASDPNLFTSLFARMKAAVSGAGPSVDPYAVLEPEVGPVGPVGQVGQGGTQPLGPLAPNPGGTGSVGSGGPAVVAPGRLGSLPNNGVGGEQAGTLTPAPSPVPARSSLGRGGQDAGIGQPASGLQATLEGDPILSGLTQQYNASRSNAERKDLAGEINARQAVLATEYNERTMRGDAETKDQYDRDVASAKAIAAAPPAQQEQVYRRQLEINPGYRGIDPEAQTGTHTMPVASAMGPFGPGSPQPTKTYPITGTDPKYPNLQAYPMAASDQADLTAKIASANGTNIKNAADAQKLWYDTVSSLPARTPREAQARDAAAAQFAANPYLAPFVPKFQGGLTQQDQATIDNTRSEMGARGNHAAYENSRLPHENSRDDAAHSGASDTHLQNLDTSVSRYIEQRQTELITYNTAKQGGPKNGMYSIPSQIPGGEPTLIDGPSLDAKIKTLNDDIGWQNQRLEKIHAQEAGASGSADSAGSLIGKDFGRSGCVRGATAFAQAKNLPFPTTDETGGNVAAAQKLLPKYGYVKTTDPSQANFFVSPGSGGKNNPSGLHMGAIDGGYSYQADSTAGGKLDTTMQRYPVPKGGGVTFWKYAGGNGTDKQTGGGKVVAGSRAEAIALLKANGYKVK